MPLGCKQVDYISFIIRRTMRQYNTGSMPSVKSDYRWKLLKVNCVCGTSTHENAWHESKRIEIPVQWILYVHNIQRDFWSTALLSVHNSYTGTDSRDSNFGVGNNTNSGSMPFQGFREPWGCYFWWGHFRIEVVLYRS